MSDHKTHQFRPALDPRRSRALEARSGAVRKVASDEQQGWDAYRKWLSRLGKPPAERAPTDPSIYSWKGYNNWAERIRQNWKADET
jgi:hypothetical protein